MGAAGGVRRPAGRAQTVKSETSSGASAQSEWLSFEAAEKGGERNKSAEMAHPPREHSRRTRTYHNLVVFRLNRTGHFDYRHAQVATDPERNEEPDRGQDGDLVALRNEGITTGARRLNQALVGGLLERLAGLRRLSAATLGLLREQRLLAASGQVAGRLSSAAAVSGLCGPRPRRVVARYQRLDGGERKLVSHESAGHDRPAAAAAVAARRVGADARR
jgi:hypothetical protein